MKDIYTPPWNKGESYEPEVAAEQPVYLWRGMRKLFLLVLGSLALTVFLGYLALR